jgi:hypothetical protein
VFVYANLCMRQPTKLEIFPKERRPVIKILAMDKNIALLLLLLMALPLWAQAEDQINQIDTYQAIIEREEIIRQKKIAFTHKRVPNYRWGYIERPHSFEENRNHVLGIYAASWALYPLSQPKVVRKKGSWRKYKENFGDLVFDRDEPFWNWFVHPISGSQLYLYYRANGYSRTESLGMTIISSTLFEFTIEIYTEPASIQDLYQTPILGSALGVVLENFSMYLLNTGNAFGRFLGHALNPATLFWFYEGRVQVIPTTNFKNKGGLHVFAEF